jgi:hypothetical protein
VAKQHEAETADTDFDAALAKLLEDSAPDDGEDRPKD